MPFLEFVDVEKYLKLHYLSVLVLCSYRHLCYYLYVLIYHIKPFIFHIFMMLWILHLDFTMPTLSILIHVLWICHKYIYNLHTVFDMMFEFIN